MEELLKELKKIKKELGDDDNKTVKEVKETLEEIINEFDEDDCILLITKNRGLIRASGAQTLGLFAVASERLSEELPIEYLTDAFIRGVAGKKNNPDKLDKDKINEILEAIKKAI